MEFRTQFVAGALLDKWSEREWDSGIQIETLEAMDRLTVQTQNSLYEIVLICPFSRDILIRGGQYFPEYTEARLAGSSLGGSFLKIGGIYVGFKMEVNAAGRAIVTSRVQSIRAASGRRSL